jgi:hypothetical protein
MPAQVRWDDVALPDPTAGSSTQPPNVGAAGAEAAADKSQSTNLRRSARNRKRVLDAAAAETTAAAAAAPATAAAVPAQPPLSGGVAPPPDGLPAPPLLTTSTSRSLYARRFHPWLSILTEIYLCHTCSCHDILRMDTPGQGGGQRRVRGGASQPQLCTAAAAAGNGWQRWGPLSCCLLRRPVRSPCLGDWVAVPRGLHPLRLNRRGPLSCCLLRTPSAIAAIARSTGSRCCCPCSGHGLAEGTAATGCVGGGGGAGAAVVETLELFVAPSPSVAPRPVRRPLRPFWRPFWLRFTYAPPVLVTKY